MKYLVGFALLLGSWMQPLHIGPWVSWHSEVLAIAALIWFALAELYFKLKTGHERIELPLLLVLPSGLAALVLLQGAAGLIEFMGDAVVISGYLLMCAFAIAIGYQWEPARVARNTAEEPPPLQLLAYTVLFGSILSTIIALVQIVDVWPGVEWVTKIDGVRRPGGNLAQANHLGTLVLMGIVSAVYLQQTHRLSGPFASVLSAVLVLGLTLTESRTALLSLGGVTLWWAWRRRIFRSAHASLLWIAFWALVLSGYWLWPSFISLWFFEQSGTRSITTVGLREDVWRQLLDAVLEKPLLGWGAGGVTEALSGVVSGADVSGPFTYAHNLVLDLAIGFGLPVAVLTCGIALYWAYKRIFATSTMDNWYALAMVIPLATHSMLEFPFAYVYLLLPAMLCIGQVARQQRTTQELRLNSGVASAILIAFLLGVIWTSREYLALEEDYRVARFEALNVGQTPDGYERPQVLLLTQLEAMLTATRVKPRPGMSNAELELLRRVANKYPWSALQNRYALSLALNEKGEEAMRQLMVIKAMHGDDHFQRIKLGWRQLGMSEYPILLKYPLP